MQEQVRLLIERGCRGDALLLVPDLCLLECASVLARALRHDAPLITAEEQLAQTARSLGCLA
jgi:hypothetical protein